MIALLRLAFGWLASGPLDRILSTVDKKIELQGDREKIKGDIIKEFYNTRADWMRAGGFWLTIIFSLPLAFWFGAVIIYSVFWCSDCAYPQDWTIAALPPPLSDWAGGIIISIFGVVGVSRLRK